MDLELSGKAVICTGAAGGIGRPVAALFAQEGARVFCVDRSDELAGGVVATLPGTGHAAYACDLRDPAAAAACVDAAVASLGGVDVLVHLAAVLVPRSIAALSAEDWDLHMEVNARSTFFLARAAADHMSAAGTGGTILVAGSSAWLSGGLSERLAYATSKGAVTTMVRGLAKAYGASGVTVNCIAPALVETEMMQAELTEGARKELAASTLLGRFATPEEIASWVVFLTSPRASFATGATFNVSGGFVLY